MRQARLADAAGADERQQRRRRQQLSQLVQLVFAADEAGERARQVVRAVARRWRRWPRASDGWSIDRRPRSASPLRSVGRPSARTSMRERVAARAGARRRSPAADAARADAGLFGELLLGQARGASVFAQELAKAWGVAAAGAVATPGIVGSVTRLSLGDGEAREPCKTRNFRDQQVTCSASRPRARALGATPARVGPEPQVGQALHQLGQRPIPLAGVPGRRPRRRGCPCRTTGVDMRWADPGRADPARRTASSPDSRRRSESSPARRLRCVTLG